MRYNFDGFSSMHNELHYLRFQPNDLDASKLSVQSQFTVHKQATCLPSSVIPFRYFFPYLNRPVSGLDLDLTAEKLKRDRKGILQVAANLPNVSRTGAV